MPLDQPKVKLLSTGFPKTSGDDATSFSKPYLNLCPQLDQGASSSSHCSDDLFKEK